MKLRNEPRCSLMRLMRLEIDSVLESLEGKALKEIESGCAIFEMEVVMLIADMREVVRETRLKQGLDFQLNTFFSLMVLSRTDYVMFQACCVIPYFTEDGYLTLVGF